MLVLVLPERLTSQSPDIFQKFRGYLGQNLDDVANNNPFLIESQQRILKIMTETKISIRENP